MKNSSLVAMLAASCCIVAIATPAHAQSVSFNIPAGSLKSALDAYGRQSGRPIVYKADEVRGAKTSGYRGAASPDTALQTILASTGFAARPGAGGAVAIVRVGNGQESTTGSSPPQTDETSQPQASEAGADILVTGTRLKGVPVASESIAISAQDIRNAGQSNLGETIRSLPANFSGGQNPSIKFQSSNPANFNFSGGSALNLRGLGPDATLTLLNGHRLSYDGESQAVDVSAIPVDAVSSIQIVPDGSSAIYGSDAVAGVANVVLKPDFDGLAVAARLGSSTDGGGFQQTYSAVGGMRGTSGGFLAAYQYGAQDPVYADQRSYSNLAALPRPSMLINKSRYHQLLFTGHIDLAPNATLRIDALYLNRNVVGFTAESPPATTQRTDLSTEGWSVAPSLDVGLGGDWELSVSGSYGRNYTNFIYNGLNIQTNATTYLIRRTYKNESRGAEAVVNGSLFDIGGERAKVAFGGGYRYNFFAEQTFSASAPSPVGSQSNVYGFAEVSIPLISPGMNIGMARRLIVSAAARYENYNTFGSVVTPKLGLLFAPTDDVDLKATWGRSFKSPTLFQQNQGQFGTLFPTIYGGGSRFPAGTTWLQMSGGNADLQPERARTWSATIDIHPRSIPGLLLSATYFNIRYRNRSVAPIGIFATTLTNPAYTPYITYNPTPAQVQAFYSRSTLPVFVVSPATYNPATVVALVDATYQNGINQRIEGVDLSAKYGFTVGASKVQLTTDLSWLTGKQQLGNDVLTNPLAGVIYYPPKLRGRGGATWSNDRFTLATYINYAGPVRNVGVTPNVDGDSMTTVDLNLIFNLGRLSGLAQSVELGLSVQNLTDVHPPYLFDVRSNVAPYDSNNYSPLGRFVSASLRLKF